MGNKISTANCGFAAGGIGRQQSGVLSIGKSRWGEKPANKPKKKLNYNEREISSQILRASKYRNAAEVLTRAKGKLGVLKRCQSTGEYDESELRTAIKHATKMVRCAKMKMTHLKEEESQDTKNKRGLIRKKKPVKDAEEMELRQKRLKHRLKERKKILEANMEYLKEKRENDSNSEANSIAAALDLSVLSMQLKELQMQEKQLKQENDFEDMELDGAYTTDVSASADGIPDQVSSAQAASADARACGTVVDIAL